MRKKNTSGSSNANHLINNRKCANKYSVDLFPILSAAHFSWGTPFIRPWATSEHKV